MYFGEVLKECFKVTTKFLPLLRADKDKEKRKIRNSGKTGLKLQEFRHQGQEHKTASIVLKVINLIQQNYSE